jgi:cell division protein FtsB
MNERTASPASSKWLGAVLWLQISLILLAIVVYGFVWFRLKPLLATRSQLQEQISQLSKETDDKKKEVASLKAQEDSLRKEVTQLAGGIGDLPDSGKQVQELKGAAKVAWIKYPPKQAWCYQERDKVNENLFSVYCHWSEDRCNKAKAYSRRATACAFVPDLDFAEWNPSPKGFWDSWYQLNRQKPLPLPFPQFQTNSGKPGSF